MTKAEASRKACPFIAGVPNCITDACMAWQPYESIIFKGRANAEFRNTGRHLESDEGYCARGAKPKDAP